MKFEKPLVEGILLRRYKRFFADVEINGEVVVAHVPNTGSMKGCNEAGSPCLVSPASNPERKLKYTLEMVKTPTSWVGVNTSYPNHLVRELWASKTQDRWSDFDNCQLEVKISKETRLDIALWNGARQTQVKNAKLTAIQPPLHFIEVKNVSLAENGHALFPDAVTERGQKHLRELMNLIEQGFTCELVFVVQRQDCETFSPADDIDPEYGKLLREAQKKGLIISPHPCDMTPEHIVLGTKRLNLTF
jgi:sugar fermentation stimulation protein A